MIAVRIRKREDDVEGELEKNDRENKGQGRREEQGGHEEAIRSGAIHFRKPAAKVDTGIICARRLLNDTPQNEVVRRDRVYLQASRIPAQLTLWLLVAALFPANSVEARVGDSRSEIEIRYGDSFAKSHDDLGNEQRSYPFRDFIVVVSFEKGRSVCETFLKSGNAGSGFQVQMSEIRAIMDANERKNVTWVPKIEGISWETSDKKLQAINLFGRLQIATKNYAERMRVIHKKQDLHHSGGR